MFDQKLAYTVYTCDLIADFLRQQNFGLKHVPGQCSLNRTHPHREEGLILS